MVGPSAIGSENGTPSSITSAPAAASACITGTVADLSGVEFYDRPSMRGMNVKGGRA